MYCEHCHCLTDHHSCDCEEFRSTHLKYCLPLPNTNIPTMCDICAKEDTTTHWSCEHCDRAICINCTTVWEIDCGYFVAACRDRCQCEEFVASKNTRSLERSNRQLRRMQARRKLSEKKGSA